MTNAPLPSRLLAACLILAAAPAPAPGDGLPEDTGFLRGGYFDQGGAEFNIYDASLLRYGQPRRGAVTHVWVKEPWDAKNNIKSAGPGQGDFEVLKLNQIVSYPTGIYRYEQMWSGFWKRDTGALVKFSFTHHEACGNTFKQAHMKNGTAEFVFHSYFEGHGDGQNSVSLPPRAVFYDELPLRLRLAASTGVQGAVAIPLFPTVIDAKSAPLQPAPATIREVRRDSDGIEFEVAHAGGADRLVFEGASPFKLQRWNMAGAGEIVLRKSMRVPYWKLNRPEDEKLLE